MDLRAQSRQLSEECELMSVTQPNILVQTGVLRKPPFLRIENIPGFNLIEQGVRDVGVTTGNSLQLHAAPYILAGRNCFLIGPSNSKGGKSLSYLMPMLTKLMKDALAGNKMPGSGPLALIVCASNKTGVKLEETIRHLLETNKSLLKMAFLEENNFDGDIPLARNRGRKYDILLATAGCVEEMVEHDVSYFNYDRLSFLIFDDADILLKYKQKEFQTIVQGFQTYIKKAGSRSCVHQTIFCGSQWTQEMEECFQHSVDIPVLIISSPVQALNYCKFDIRVVKASFEADGAFETFKGILKQNVNVKRILVVVHQLDTLKELERLCRMQGIVVNVLGTGKVGVEEISRARWNWVSENFDRVIVLTTDISIHELKISTASLLIHYEIPVDDLRSFALRFSSIWGNARDLTQENGKNSQSRSVSGTTAHVVDVVSYVILQPNLPQEPTIVTTLHKLGATICPTLLDSAKKAMECANEDKKLCLGFKCFGRCTEFDETKCPDRHFFIRSDFEEPSVLPRTAQVELRIKESMRPNLFRAQVVRYGQKDPITNKIVNITDCAAEVLRRSELLKKLVADKKLPSTYKPGTKVVITVREKVEYRFIYTRAVIIKVQTRNYAGLPNSILVKCMDVGETLTRNVDDEVFSMPPEMESLTNLSVEVILANTAPPLGELDFRITQYEKAINVVKTDILEANIALSIGDTIWVKRLVRRKKLNCGQLEEDWSAFKAMEKERILVRNPNHLDTLYKLCENVNFSCDIYKTPQLSTAYTDDQSDNASITGSIVSLDEGESPANGTENAAPDDEEIVTNGTENAAPDDEEIVTNGTENAAPDDEEIVTNGTENAAPDDEEIVTNGTENAVPESLLRAIDSRLQSWTDDEDDGDDDDNFDFNFDVPLEELREILSGRIKKVDNDPRPKSFIEEVHEERPRKKAVRNGNSTGQSTNGMANRAAITPCMNTEVNVASSSSVQHTSMKQPTVHWYEKDDHVILKVMVPDIKEYDWSLTNNKTKIHFKTIIPPDFEFELKLLRKVEMNPVVIKPWGQYCEIKLTKRLKGAEPWLTLTNEKGLRWLKPDYAMLIDEDRDIPFYESIEYMPVNHDQMVEENENSDDEILDVGTNYLDDNAIE